MVRRPFKQILLLSLLGGTVILGVSFLNFWPRTTTPNVKGSLVSVVTTASDQPGIPVRLKIPKIKVDAAIQKVGINGEGIMEAPEIPSATGWYELGPRPGETGSAVIAGHFGWKDNIPAAFDNLAALRPGDKVYVEDAKGSTAVFIVRELRNYGEHQDATDVFRSTDGKEHLNLITCGGAWNKALKSYASRLIVFTDKVSE